MKRIVPTILGASCAFFFALLPSVAIAGDNDLCAPGFRPVPHPVPDGKTPNWWVDQTYEEQRWNGASQRSFSPNSMTSEVGWMRTLYSPSDRYLYLHVHSETDSSVDPSVDHIVVALTPSAATKRLLMVIDPYSAAGCDDGECSAVDLAPVIQYAVTGGVSGWTDYLPTSDPQLEPWTTTGTLAEHPMIWAATQASGPSDTRYVYDVKLRVRMPVDFAAGADLYANMIVGYATGPSSVATVQYPWPRDAGVSGPNDISISDATNSDETVRAGMGGVSFGDLSSAPICSDGVVLENTDIYTDLGGNQIRNSATETTKFYAAFTNNTGATVDAGQVQADFYLAEWGINPGGEIWQKMNSAPVPLVGNVADGAKANGSGGSGQIELSWAPSAAQLSAFSANSHQCLQAKLSAAGGATLDFGRDSAWRNLDFVDASVYEDTASVLAVGAGETPQGMDAHRIWLHVEPHMMPSVASCEKGGQVPGCDNGDGKALTLLPPDRAAEIEAAQRKQLVSHLEQIGEGKGAARRGAKLLAAMKTRPAGAGDVVGALSFDQMPSGVEGATSWEQLPRLVVRGFRETGRKVGLKDKSFPILEPWGSYGYVVQHEGPLQGWEYFLRGKEGELVELANGWYYIDLKDGEVATVSTVIRAIDEDTPTCAAQPEGEGCQRPELESRRAWKSPWVVEDGQVDPPVEPVEPVKPGAEDPSKRKGCKCDVSEGASGLPTALGLLLLGGGLLVRRRRRRR